MCKLSIERTGPLARVNALWRRLRGEPDRPAVDVPRLEAEVERVYADNAALRIRNDEIGAALAEAAAEINVAGPVAHRIRMLKQAHEHEYGRLVSQTDQEIARLRKELETATLRVRDRNLTIAAAIAGERELRIERDAWRSLAGRVTAQLADESRRYDTLALHLADLVGTMRRDGFNPRPAHADDWPGVRGPPWEDTPTARSSIDPELEAAQERLWMRVVEAAQERSAGNAELQTRILADAHRWRAMGLPLEEVEQRVWAGEGI
jgi:hypothetical protein